MVMLVMATVMSFHWGSHQYFNNYVSKAKHHVLRGTLEFCYSSKNLDQIPWSFRRQLLVFSLVTAFIC